MRDAGPEIQKRPKAQSYPKRNMKILIQVGRLQKMLQGKEAVVEATEEKLWSAA